MERKKRFHGNVRRYWKRRAQVFLLALAFMGAAAAGLSRKTEDVARIAGIHELADQAAIDGGCLKVERKLHRRPV